MKSFGLPIEMLFVDLDDLSDGELRHLNLDAVLFAHGYMHHDMWLSGLSSHDIDDPSTSERDVRVRAILDRAWWRLYRGARLHLMTALTQLHAALRGRTATPEFVKDVRAYIQADDPSRPFSPLPTGHAADA